jgi:hypothetical protein
MTRSPFLRGTLTSGRPPSSASPQDQDLMRVGVNRRRPRNWHALDAALAFLADQDVEAYLCAGDLVGYGPLPNECVRRVRDPPGPVASQANHDLIVLGRLSDERCVPLARSSLRWTRTALDADARGFLAGLPLGAGEGTVAVRHGSVSDPQEYVLAEEQAVACLSDIRREDPDVTVLILGHTHRPMAFGERSGWLLRESTGSVGLPPGEAILLKPGSGGPIAQPRRSGPSRGSRHDRAGGDLSCRPLRRRRLPCRPAGPRPAAAVLPCPSVALERPRRRDASSRAPSRRSGRSPFMSGSGGRAPRGRRA